MIRKLSQTKSWPVFSEEEIHAVSEVLQSGNVNYWTGEHGKLFEQEFAEFIGCQHAIVLANGTLALELALNVLDIGFEDEVIVPSRTFIATASSVVARGASPVVADIDRDSGNVTVDTIYAVHTEKTKAIIVVHLAGWPCDMVAIMDYAKTYNLLVIEDCAQCHGAEINGRKLGSFGHAAAFSFCQDKIMTTGGEGGMLLLNGEALWKKAWAYKDHGKSYDAVFNQEHPQGFRWLHESFGSNFRMTEMQAAIGRKQLTKLSKWVDSRNRNASILKEAIKGFSVVRCPEPPVGYQHAYYKFYCYVQSELLKSDWSRDRIITEISKLGVPCFSGSCSEIYLEKAFDCLRARPRERLSVAKELGETSLMLLVDHTISREGMDYASNVLRDVLTQASIDKSHLLDVNVV